MIRGFDFHCHPDLHPDPVSIFTRCREEKIVTLAVTTTPKAWEQNCIWAKNNDYVHVALGLHPELVSERYDEADLMICLMNESRFIGEIGLDGSPKYKESYAKQQQIFGGALDTAQGLSRRVLTIHSRRAAHDVITMIQKQTTPERVRCILHWFSGTISEAEKAIEIGCYFSINHKMLSYDRGRKLVQILPLDLILTETDSPFTSVDRRKSHPWDVIVTTTQLAELRGIHRNVMQSILQDNASEVFSFAGVNLPSN